MSDLKCSAELPYIGGLLEHLRGIKVPIYCVVSILLSLEFYFFLIRTYYSSMMLVLDIAFSITLKCYVQYCLISSFSGMELGQICTGTRYPKS